MAMYMLARLRYLRQEGFEILQVKGWTEPERSGEAIIYYRFIDGCGAPRLYSEHFYISERELEACCRLASMEKQ